ncbi:hypothetical protein [Paraburkholderia bannensis]|uniref:hypothetical protein n=1 Tax=Paraburkholderia bannensis TaxID=765414 RepID=UPI002AAFD2EB|nr:hypothetical protein [Paraburkholderia bannensis]
MSDFLVVLERIAARADAQTLRRGERPYWITLGPRAQNAAAGLMRGGADCGL